MCLARTPETPSCSVVSSVSHARANLNGIISSGARSFNDGCRLLHISSSTIVLPITPDDCVPVVMLVLATGITFFPSRCPSNTESCSCCSHNSRISTSIVLSAPDETRRAEAAGLLLKIRPSEQLLVAKSRDLCAGVGKASELMDLRRGEVLVSTHGRGLGHGARTEILDAIGDRNRCCKA